MTVEARAAALRAALLVAKGKLQDWQAEALLDGLIEAADDEAHRRDRERKRREKDEKRE